MRILMLTQFYLPVIGGEERFVRDCSTALAERGHEVAVATLCQAGQSKVMEQDAAGVRVYRIQGMMQRIEGLFSETDRRHAPPFPDPEVLAGLRRVVAQERPDIVHAHNWLVHSFLPLKAWSKAILVMTLHDYSFACAKKRLMYAGAPCTGPGFSKCMGCATAHYGMAKGIPTVLGNWAMGMIQRALVDMFLPESYAVAEGNGLIGSRLPFQIMPVFVSDDVGTPREGFDSYLQDLPQGDFLLFVGDLSRDKGVDVLLQAYSALALDLPLVLIGRQSDDLPQLPPNVIVLGSWPHAAVMEAWRRCTIALIPSVWPEPFGLVVLEAMATASPVIASRIGGIKDIVIDGVTGILVPPGDSQALSQAILRLLADSDLRERMGKAGKQRVTAFQAKTVIPRYERVYHQMINP